MKKFIILLLIGFGILSVQSCTEVAKKTTAVTVLVDNTEKVTDNHRLAMISDQSLINIVDGGTGTVKFQQINSVSINTTASVVLQYKEDPTPHQIKEAEDEFKNQLSALKTKFLGPTEDTKSTSLWKTMCENIKELEESGADQKVLIVMSDMIEFSGNGDFYHTSVKDIKKIKQRMLDSCGVNTLPDASGISLIILYNPNGDAGKERKFNQAMEIWKLFLEEANIPYKLQPNI